ncbi:MAG: vWA domain-containing protein [Leucobacter sp.]
MASSSIRTGPLPDEEPSPRRDSTATRGLGELTTVPYRGASDEIDLDATIAVLAEHPVPEDEDILVRERLRVKRSIVLLVDVSGSMKGERINTAAATVGAVAGELSDDALAVIAFWSDAAVVLPLGGPVQPSELLDRILRIPARGLTNVAFPLEAAAEQLARVPAREARVILLSDCVHNAGPDPRPSPRDCRGSMCSSTRAGRRTSSSAASSPRAAAASAGWCAATGMSRPRSPRCSGAARGFHFGTGCHYDTVHAVVVTAREAVRLAGGRREIQGRRE